ncbi:MAG: N-acetyl-gamma-glutamyl-phosphate reductase [Clostridia bacterium]|nr:N-acetyl-gamma-glutamyl-phosphate reductase [Clostridia bacterium]
MTKVFIDGSAGTTGLRIYERLQDRKDLELLRLPEELRKDRDARHEMLNLADIVFLCLPDDAARESAEMVENVNTRVIDTSTAHRTNESWTYGFPEIRDNRERIRDSRRIANPGCHASGVISLLAPLTESGIIKKDINLSCFSITGYSGGGKKMIAEYEEENRDMLLDAPRMYGITQSHKHLPEIQKVCGLEKAPVFCPIVAPFYSGMEVTIPLHKSDINGNIEDVRRILRDYYKTGLVRYSEENENGFMSAHALSGRDDMEVSVCGNEDRIILVSRFDNLGKGASGSAIQNMNIILGLDEKTGLNV